MQRQWRWQPGLPSQPNPEQIELSFVDVTRTLVPANGDTTYFTLPTQRRIRQEQGQYPPLGNPGLTVEAYVAQVESSGGAIMLADSTAKVTDFDEFGNALADGTEESLVSVQRGLRRIPQVKRLTPQVFTPVVAYVGEYMRRACDGRGSAVMSFTAAERNELA